MGQDMSALNALLERTRRMFGEPSTNYPRTPSLREENREADQRLKEALERVREAQKDAPLFPAPWEPEKPIPHNVEVDCAYCGKSFVTAKGGTQGECPSCGAPIRKGPRRVE